MITSRLHRLLLIGALSALCLALMTAALPIQTAQADLGGGLFSAAGNPITLSNGASYTVSSRFTSAVYVGLYGSIQIMASNAGTAAQVLTITPQFSNQDGVCTSATLWFTSTHYMDYQPYSVASNGTTITETVGAWTSLPVLDQLSVTGTAVVGREFSAQGRCLRLKLDWSNAGQPYTPTLILRALNRN